jgi:hypothetical protein
MRKSVIGLAALLAGSLLSGCASSTVSQYAGLPPSQLPKDHLGYEPARPARTSENASRSKTAGATAELSLDDENRRLAKMLKICRNCGDAAPDPEGSPSESGPRSAALR